MARRRRDGPGRPHPPCPGTLRGVHPVSEMTFDARSPLNRPIVWVVLVLLQLFGGALTWRDNATREEGR